MIYYDYITSKDYEDEDYKEMLSKYVQQERNFRNKYDSYVDNMTLHYEEINRNAPVTIRKINDKENKQ